MARALVVGGTGGLGKAAAQVLVDAGMETWVTGRKNTPPTGSRWVPLEIENSFQGLKKLEESYPYFGSTDYLVCAFGPYRESSLEESTDIDWISLVDLNLSFPGALVSRVLGGMKKRRFGRILLFGATGSDQILGKKLSSVYQAAKTGLGVLAKSVALEAGNDSVQCNVLCPGYVFTEYYTEEMLKRGKRALGARKPLNPQDWHPLFRSLLLEDQGIMNGAVISAGQGL